jgi:hypothetical protein
VADAQFHYIAEPIFDAAQTDTLTVEINPETTELSDIADTGWNTFTKVSTPKTAEGLSSAGP